MSKTVQFKRGNANVSATYVGAQGEITVNTDNYTLNVHDGIRAGGYTILNANVSNIGNLSVTNQTIIGTSANTNITLSPNNANVVLTSNLVTPNIAINLYTVQSVNSGSSLTLPAQSDGANIDLNNTFSNIRFTTYDSTTNAPYTLVLNRDSDVVFPGYLKSSLGSAEIQFAGGQGLLMYANFDTGSTGISLNDTGTSDIFANVDLRLTTNYSGAGKQWLFGSNGTLTTTGNLSTANLSISHAVANNTVQVRTLTNSDLKLVATNGTYQSAIYLWANNQRMSFNTVSNAFDFNFNGQLSATDFTASKNSNVGYSFYAEGSGYSGFRHSSGPPDVITIVHEGNVFAGFYGNYTTQFYGNLVVSGDGETFGSFPDAYVQVYSNVDTYSQFVLQNINDGSDASTDVVVTADNGNDSTYYINMGILGSNHAVPDFFGDVRNYDDGYLIVVGNSATGGAANVGNLILGSTNGVVKTFVGNTAEANVVTVVTEFGLMPGANVTYSLGSETNQWQDLWVSNNTIYIGGVALTVDGSGNLTVNGNVVSGGDGSNYGNSNVASYLTTYTGNIAGNIVKNGYAWTFGTDGDLTLPREGRITGIGDGGPAGDRYGYISWAGNTSGDGAGYNTMRLVPDSLGLEDADQYIILDPTSPGHIHIRAGGTQDNSQSNLYFGGENSYVLIGAGTNPPVTIAANNATWTFDSDGNLALPASGVLLVSGGITAGPIISSPAPYLSGFSSISAVSMSASGNITGNTGGFAIGYRDIPQVVFTSNATLALTDAGKHYFSSNSANVITVPNNATVSFNIGTAISIVQQGTANLTINPDGGVTMYLAGNATSSSRLLGNYGMATIMKVDTDTWFINGTGLT